uniref:Uncharacterized protein n=1 Tax=Avena sativa TaxID=4498 RepID=A0ACD5X5Q6_AVESA
MWLAVHRRCLTADNLGRRGWPCTDTYQLCLSKPKTCTHLFVHCPFASQVWRLIKRRTTTDFPIPGSNFASTEDWWLQVRKRAPKSNHRDFDAVVILVYWRIWKERNSRVFESTQHYPKEIFDLIREDIRLWRTAGKVIAI